MEGRSTEEFIEQIKEGLTKVLGIPKELVDDHYNISSSSAALNLSSSVACKRIEYTIRVWMSKKIGEKKISKASYGQTNS